MISYHIVPFGSILCHSEVKESDDKRELYRRVLGHLELRLEATIRWCKAELSVPGSGAVLIPSSDAKLTSVSGESGSGSGSGSATAVISSGGSFSPVGTVSGAATAVGEAGIAGTC